MFELGHHGRPFQLLIIHLFFLRRRDVADRFQYPPMVEPVDPFQRGILDGIDVPPRSAPADHLGLEQADDRFRQGVVVRVADTADRRLDSGLGKSLGVADLQVLAAPVAVMHQTLGSGS